MQTTFSVWWMGALASVVPESVCSFQCGARNRILCRGVPKRFSVCREPRDYSRMWENDAWRDQTREDAAKWSHDKFTITHDKFTTSLRGRMRNGPVRLPRPSPARRGTSHVGFGGRALRTFKEGKMHFRARSRRVGISGNQDACFLNPTRVVFLFFWLRL